MTDDTRIVQAGRDVSRDIDVVNPPVYRASTVLYPTLAALDDPARPYSYGRRGTPTTRALEDALSELEGGSRTVLYPSGLAAIAGALLAVLQAGDHLLVTDACYLPTRRFCERTLTRLGIAVDYYPPTIGAGIAALMTARTRAVMCESPGSHSFEVQDIPAIAAAARAAGACVLVDNTWASPLFHKPLALGANLSIHSATKYIAGHADVVLGSVTADAATARRLVEAHGLAGQCAGPDDAWLTLRGLRTLAPRLARHQASGLALARWFAEQPDVEAVLHPGLPSFPTHALWQRDFTGASGTFGVVFKPCPKAALAALVDGLAHFGIGYSFGGFESLVVPSALAVQRTAGPPFGAHALRFHVGLEDPADLIADLAAGLARFRAALAS